MISRPILEEKKKLYEQGREQAVQNISALNGAIECIDDLLRILDSFDKYDEEATLSAEQEQLPE
jgi:hypothetical protein